MIETICENCGNLKVFEDSYVGRKFKCPVCGEVVEIKPLKTAELAEKNKVSDASTNVIINKRKQELEKKIQDIHKEFDKLWKEREERDKGVDEYIKDCKDDVINKIDDSKKTLKIYCWIYLIDIALILLFGVALRGICGEAIMSILMIVFFLGWIPLGMSLSGYKNCKKLYFDNYKDLIYNKSMLRIWREDCIKNYYRNKTDSYYHKREHELNDRLSALVTSLEKIEYPEDGQSDSYNEINR